MALDAMEPVVATGASPVAAQLLTTARIWEARSTTMTTATALKHVAAYPAPPSNTNSHNNTHSSNSSAQSKAMRRKNSVRSGLRKSMSDKPLHDDYSQYIDSSSSTLAMQPTTAYHFQTSASLQSVVADGGDSERLESFDTELAARRQFIVARAEEIARGARHVGMQFGETCPVCLADDVDAQLTECGHRIHAKCIKRWIQSGTQCPVCREQVTDVQAAFTPPSRAHFRALEKDRELPLADDASTSLDECDGDDDDRDSGDSGNGDDAGFEWGWFEDFDEFDDQNDDNTHCGGGLELLCGTGAGRRASLPSAFARTCSSNGSRSRSGSHSLSHAPLLNRELSSAFEICRTFPPLRPVFDAPYALSRHAWLRVLPSHRHIAAKLQIRSFRIVESRNTHAQHAEYLVETQLDGRYFSRWRRFSAIARFVSTIGTSEFRDTHAAWKVLVATSRWFNRLELSYLHERCKLLEHFAHTLLIECTTAHPIGDLLES